MQQSQIKTILKKIQGLIINLPEAKQQKAIFNLQKTTIIQDEKKQYQELQYQYNFIKLTNPTVKEVEIDDNMMPIEQEQIQEKKQEEHPEVTKLKNATYVLKDGKLVEGQAEKKEIAEFSNWYAGNVDPGDLKKHKEMLDRQHFSGPFWKNRPKPISILKEENPNVQVYSDEPPIKEINPNLLKPRQADWQQVKR